MASANPIRNYGELKKQILSWLDREDTEVTEKLPTFVQIAERRIFRILRTPNVEKFTQYQLKVGEYKLQIPGDFAGLIDISVSGYGSLTLTDRAYVRGYINQNGGFDLPKRYTRIGGEWWVVPPSDAVRDVVVEYHADLSGQLDDEEDTNDYLRIAPDAYLFGSLVAASAFIHGYDRERVSEWNDRYLAAISELDTMTFLTDHVGGANSVRAPYRS